MSTSRSPPHDRAVITLKSLDETKRLAQAIAERLRPGDLVGLDGALGGGKTTFTRALVGALEGGSDAEVTSPTFAILNLYETRPPVLHLDLYRLAGVDDLETTGFWDIWEDGDCIAVIEWMRRVGELADTATWHLSFTAPSLNTRVVYVEAAPKRLMALKAELPELLAADV